MNAKVSIMNAINEVLDMTGADHSNDIPVLKRWAVNADRRIGAKYDWKKQIHVLDVIGCVAELPFGVIWVRGVIFGDAGCDCGLSFDFAFNNLNLIDKATGVETTSGFLAIDLITTKDLVCPSRGGLRWEVQDNNLIFDQDLNGQKVTVQVLQYQLDSQGFPLINENNVEAIAQYLEYRLMKRSRWAKDRRERIDRGEIRDAFEEWHRLCSDARATTSRMSVSERAEVAAMYNDPLSGHGFGVPSAYENDY